MAGLVVGHDVLLLLVHQAVALLQAGHHALDGVLEVLRLDLVLAPPGGQKRGLVDQVGQVGAHESGSHGGQLVEVNRIAERHISGVHVQYAFPVFQVGGGHHDVPVEPSRPQQGGVQHLRPVGGGQQDDALLRLEAVHLHQKGIQRLLALVVASAPSHAPGLAKGVQLVYEDDARGRCLLGLLEQVAHPGGADADEHLHEVRAAQAEERHPRLAGNRLGQQRLARARRADQQHALGDAAAQARELRRVAQELHHLLQFLLALLDAGHVVEGHAYVLLCDDLGAALAEVHHAADRVHASEYEAPGDHYEQYGQDPQQQRVLQPGG